jgi:UDP-GlcNAc3NAcA epimerase
MKRIVTVVGARPQFIKVAPVSAALHESGSTEEFLVHTGQHFDAEMSDIFFAELGITPPAYNLSIHGGTHGAMTGEMMKQIEPLLVELKPDCVLVYGDTNSTLAGALTAAKLHVPVAHVEAGLRSFNKKMPEEINRILTDHISEFLFASTSTARHNLLKEGVASSHIHDVGDVMYDAALRFATIAKNTSNIVERMLLDRVPYVLATIHRAENTDDPVRLSNIAAALDDVADSMPVVLPLHPRTRQKFAEQGIQFRKVTPIDPVGYLDMISLESQAALIVTDSGGVQKEAFFFKIPCVTLRDETEWTELIESGWNLLLSPKNSNLSESILSRIGRQGTPITPYGRGNSANLIAGILAE